MAFMSLCTYQGVTSLIGMLVLIHCGETSQVIVIKAGGLHDVERNLRRLTMGIP